ncbi:MAG: EAL domain-containing protein [Roseiarcus sp.]|jgi:diguanylate cyclase (GGDEF)-like protein
MSVAAFLNLFKVETGKPDLLQAQVKALSRQIPLLFFITVVNTLALAFTHYGAAPDNLTLYFPAVFTIGYFWRGLYWANLAHRPISDADAAALLKLTALVAPACSLILLVWALALFQYSDPYAQGHVLFFLAATLLSCTLCMMHLRPAALVMTGVTAIPFALFFLATGRPVYIAVAASMLLVSAAMIYVLMVFWRDFANMIDYHRGLVDSLVENTRLANLDSLTGLPNRRQFLFALQEDLDEAARDQQRLVIGLVDLDGFKSVNDLYGHTVGDGILIEASARLLALCDRTTLLARLGGDEFGLIIDGDMSETEIQALGARICDALETPFALPGLVVEISGSVGFAAFPQAGSTAPLLFERAKYALTHGKQHLRGRATIFSIDHETAIHDLANLENCLRHADLDSEMSLHFQPIVDTDRGKIIAFESLARWVSPTLGRVPPDVFVRVAERSDLINKLTGTLLRRALAEARTWPADIGVSFNLSARDLTSSEAISNIVGLIRNSGVAPGRIDLEVTETALIRDLEEAKAALQTLKTLGVGISLDDFGTGYSSLSYIRRFPIDKIKIDRSFVKEVETDPDCRAIVKSMIDMCRNLKLACIVEGMETDNQVRTLRRLGCMDMQGYFFGKPMPAAEVLGFLDAALLPLAS